MRGTETVTTFSSDKLRQYRRSVIAVNPDGDSLLHNFWNSGIFPNVVARSLALGLLFLLLLVLFMHLERNGGDATCFCRCCTPISVVAFLTLTNFPLF